MFTDKRAISLKLLWWKFKALTLCIISYLSIYPFHKCCQLKVLLYAFKVASLTSFASSNSFELEYGKAFDIETTVLKLDGLKQFIRCNKCNAKSLSLHLPQQNLCFLSLFLPFFSSQNSFLLPTGLPKCFTGMSFIFSLFFSLANDWLRLEEFIHLRKSLNSYLNLRLFPVSNTVLVKHTCFWHVRQKLHAQWISSA